MKASSQSTIDMVVLTALIRLATTESPLRLHGKGTYPALFPNNSGINKEAIALSIAEPEPLLRVNGKAKDATVQLTATGFCYVAPQIPIERIGVLANELLASLDPKVHLEFLAKILDRAPMSCTVIEPLCLEAFAAEKKNQEEQLKIAAQMRAAEDANQSALIRILELIKLRKQTRIDNLQKQLLAEGAQVPIVPLPIEPRKIVPATKEDAVFRRQIARSLVNAWIEAWDNKKVEVRNYMESAIWNTIGFQMLGSEGEKVAFDGEFHQSSEGISRGSDVIVIRPGWRIDEDDDCFYVITKAIVQPLR